MSTNTENPELDAATMRAMLDKISDWVSSLLDPLLTREAVITDLQELDMLLAHALYAPDVSAAAVATLTGKAR